MIINKKEQQEIPKSDYEFKDELFSHVLALTLTPVGNDVGDCIETDFDPYNDDRYGERVIINNKLYFRFKRVQVGQKLWRIWRRL